jgi:hypothetical protein
LANKVCIGDRFEISQENKILLAQEAVSEKCKYILRLALLNYETVTVTIQ